MEAFHHVIRLRTVYRQRDPHFREFPDRVRTGAVNAGDHDYALRRMVHSVSPRERQRFEAAAHVFSTNKEVDHHNDTVMRRAKRPVARVAAVHRSGGSVARNATQRDARYPTMQLLEIGGSVMLLRNVLTDAGLVNGAVGRIVYVLFRPGMAPPRLPTAIIVEVTSTYTGPNMFVVTGGCKRNAATTGGSGSSSGSINHDVSRWIVLTPHTHCFRVGGTVCSRTAYDVRASYAGTVHKFHGSSLDMVAAFPYDTMAGSGSTRRRRFGVGYAARSRARSVENMLLQNMSLRDLRGPEPTNPVMAAFLRNEIRIDALHTTTMAAMAAPRAPRRCGSRGSSGGSA